VTRVGIGFDAHRLVEGRALVLGGERIDHPRGLAGHSDGDALLHALADALLGSVAAPDIGALFPSGDPKWKDAESRVFVERALALVRERGYRVSSVDVVVIAEAPRLAPHVASIRDRLAKLLGVEPGAVGLKATTTDGMGFTGRGEGIAVQAVVTVTKTAAPGGRLV
jgi:2-C-methyl-D-erythritol 2,4-cyclodiphosphate synthase